MKFRLTHEFAATADEYWDAFFDELHQDEMYHRMKAKRRLLSFQQDGDRIEMSQAVTPERELPLVLRKLIRGGTLGYTEYWSFDRALYAMQVRVAPTVFTERVQLGGRYFTEPAPSGALTRVFDCELIIHVPLVGKAVERIIHSDMKNSFGVAAQVSAEWIERRRSAAGAPGQHA